MEPAKALWNTALPIAYTNSILDSRRCKTFTEIIRAKATIQYVIGSGSRDNGRSRASTAGHGQGDWRFNANNYLKVSKAEDWTVLLVAQRTPMQAMLNGANAYLDLFADKHVEAPWGTPCERMEGGAYTNRKNDPNSSCKVGIPNGILYIVNRDYVVDEEKGVVNIFCRFGNSNRHAGFSVRYVSERSNGTRWRSRRRFAADGGFLTTAPQPANGSIITTYGSVGLRCGWRCCLAAPAPAVIERARLLSAPPEHRDGSGNASSK
jgi:hypothetical protein